MPSSSPLAAGRAAWVLAVHHVLTIAVGFLEPTELLHESVPYGGIAPSWGEDDPGDQTTSTTTLQVKDVSKVLLW